MASSAAGGWDKEVEGVAAAFIGADEEAVDSEATSPLFVCGSDVIDEVCLSSTPPASFAASKFLISSDVRCKDSDCGGSVVAGASVALVIEAMIAMVDNQ